MKKSECLASNSLKTQPGKPCFNNFDFQAHLSISKTAERSHISKKKTYNSSDSELGPPVLKPARVYVVFVLLSAWVNVGLSAFPVE